MKFKLFIFFIFLAANCFSQSAKKLLKQAYDEIESKNYQIAENTLTEALKLDPENYKCFLARAEARELLHKMPESLEDYVAYLKYKPGDSKVLMKVADIKIALKKFEQALIEIDLLIKDDGSNIAAYSKKTWCLINLKKFKEAITTCDISLTKNNESHQTYFFKAVALDSIKDYNSALKEYTTALTLANNQTTLSTKSGDENSRYKPYFANLALVQHRLKKYEEAIKNFSQATLLDPKDLVEPKNAAVYFQRAESYLAISDYANSIGDLCKTIVLNSQFKNGYLRRGFVYQQTKQFQSAISDYTKAIQMEENNFSAIKSRGICYKELDMLTEAIADFTKAITINSSDNEVKAYLDESQKKLFELNREKDAPEINVIYPIIELDGFINIFANQQDVIFEGNIKDKSLLEKVVINGITAQFENEKNPSFRCRISTKDLNMVDIIAIDVYGNTASKKIKIGRIVDESKVKVVFSGRIVTDNELSKPFANCNVLLVNEKGEIMFAAKTDDKGKFTFKNLPFEKNYLMKIDAEEGDFGDITGFRMEDANGKVIMTSRQDGKSKFKFEILPMDYNVLSLMTVEDAPLQLDIKGRILADNDDKTPIGNVKILLLNERKEAMTFTNTDADARFLFKNVIPYDYEYAIDEIDVKRIPFERLLVTDDKGRVLKQITKDSEGNFRFKPLPAERFFLSHIAVEDIDPWLNLGKMNNEKNEVKIIENIYYESGSWKLLPEAEIIMKKAIDAMQKNPKLTLEVQSHTDAVASDEYNMDLSIKRANAVVEYITKNGQIDTSRLKATGFGESQLSNRCANGVECSDAEHKQNRRTVFVLSYNENKK
ncbi:MAG: OmpA family protein [Bacteroidota bacterium]|jgi:tetratricopeptide (TPR) repeat protein